jgi:hypothetical protein
MDQIATNPEHEAQEPQHYKYHYHSPQNIRKTTHLSLALLGVCCRSRSRPTFGAAWSRPM